MQDARIHNTRNMYLLIHLKDYREKNKCVGSVQTLTISLETPLDGYGLLIEK